MKKYMRILLAALLICTLSGCGTNRDAHIPDGFIRAEEHWDPDGIQDYTDFCIYWYDTVRPIQADSVYREVTEDDIPRLLGYFSNFRGWMEAEHRMDEYSFDDGCITPGDFFFVKTKEGQPIGKSSVYGVYDNYSVFFFDRETLTLYYIHTNI